MRCGLGFAALPRSLRQAGLVVVDDGLPALPPASLVARHAAGDIHPAAERFVALLGEEIARQRA